MIDFLNMRHQILGFIGILLLIVFGFCVGLSFVNMLFGNKQVEYYYLSSVSMKGLTIMTQIDNSQDGSLILQNVTYEDAVKMVNELNDGLAKVKRGE